MEQAVNNKGKAGNFLGRLGVFRRRSADDPKKVVGNPDVNITAAAFETPVSTPRSTPSSTPSSIPLSQTPSITRSEEESKVEARDKNNLPRSRSSSEPLRGMSRLEGDDSKGSHVAYFDPTEPRDFDSEADEDSSSTVTVFHNPT